MRLDVKFEGMKEWSQSEKAWARDVIQKTNNEIEKIALSIERDAKMTVPVDTGELRGSISTTIRKTNSKASAEVGTDVEYAEVVEFGGRNQRAQPYLIPSFERNVSKLERSISDVLRG